MASTSSRFGWQRTYADLIRGLNEPNEIEIRVDGMRVGTFTIGGGAEFAAAAAAAAAQDRLGVRIR